MATVNTKQAQAIEWWERHQGIRRGTKRRLASRESAERRFGVAFIDGLLHGVQHALVLAPMGDEFNDGYWAGQEWRWQQRKEKNRNLAKIWTQPPNRPRAGME